MIELKNKNIVVTGGAGFLGSHLVPLLLGRNNNVVVLDNFSNGRIENLEPVLDHPELVVIRGDTTKMDDVEKAFEGAEVVIHLSVLGLRQSIKEPLPVKKVIVDGTLNCLEIAERNKVKLFVNCSSSEVYGTKEYIPMDEKHPLNPTTPYGAAKVAQDMYVAGYGRTYGLPWLTVRPFNMYGPNSYWRGMRGELIPKMIIRAMNRKPLIIFGDGSQTRDFTYVEDVAAAITEMTGIPDFLEQNTNVCCGNEISIKEIAEMILKSFSLDPGEFIQNQPPRPGEVMRHRGDNSKLRRALTAKSFIPLEEGLNRTIEWVRSLPQTPEELLSQEQVRAWE